MACKGAQLVKKKKAQKVMDLLPKATMADKKEIAAECGVETYRETYDILACLIREDDRDLQLLCVKAFGVNADPRAIVHLQWLRGKLSTDDTEMMDAIKDAMASCRAGHQG